MADRCREAAKAKKLTIDQHGSGNKIFTAEGVENAEGNWPASHKSQVNRFEGHLPPNTFVLR